MQKEHMAGIIAILAGSLIIVFRSWFANNIIEAQNRVWGYNFGEREIKASKFVAFLVGICAIVWGLLVLFRII